MSTDDCKLYHGKDVGDEGRNLDELASLSSERQKRVPAPHEARRMRDKKIDQIAAELRKSSCQEQTRGRKTIKRVPISLLETKQMAKILEAHLFHRAATWTEYMDERTTRARLTWLAEHYRATNGTTWQQRVKENKCRCEMISRIIKMLNERLPPRQRDKIVHQIPRMAQKLELSLYQSASSLTEYEDKNSLPSRLSELALGYRSLLPTFVITIDE